MERASALRLVEQRRPDFCARSACLAPVTGELSPPRGRNAAHCAGWSLQLQRRSASRLWGSRTGPLWLTWAFYAARSYSLRRPPSTGRRLTRTWERSATG